MQRIIVSVKILALNIAIIILQYVLAKIKNMNWSLRVYDRTWGISSVALDRFLSLASIWVFLNSAEPDIRDSEIFRDKGPRVSRGFAVQDMNWYSAIRFTSSSLIPLPSGDLKVELCCPLRVVLLTTLLPSLVHGYHSLVHHFIAI